MAHTLEWKSPNTSFPASSCPQTSLSGKGSLTLQFSTLAKPLSGRGRGWPLRYPKKKASQDAVFCLTTSTRRRPSLRFPTLTSRCCEETWVLPNQGLRSKASLRGASQAGLRAGHHAEKVKGPCSHVFNKTCTVTLLPHHGCSFSQVDICIRLQWEGTPGSLGPHPTPWRLRELCSRLLPSC